jgi:hypothetical protein
MIVWVLIGILAIGGILLLLFWDEGQTDNEDD